MNDGEVTSVDKEPERKRPLGGYDFSNLQGLQVVGGQADVCGDHAPDDSFWREALKLELEARAARFHLSVDASIVLASDGVIRWLGDPIAKLAAGPDMFTPRAVVLADASLPDGARDVVAARLELWLAATTRRLLGPLFALRDLTEGSDAVRGLAARIAGSLGVLEREPVRRQIKALDQISRAALRKYGVRFGAHYVYVPTVLKPAARALALHLWSLQAPEADGEGMANSLVAIASSGRTSLPVDRLISKDGYRIAGFRLCGERLVRVDILERLTDMIRAESVLRASSQPARPVFVVNGLMTSLAGCSGEVFASVLRSLGFESFEVARSELVFPRPAVETTATSATDSATGAPEDSVANHAPQPTSFSVVDASEDSVLEQQPKEEKGTAPPAPETEEPIRAINHCDPLSKADTALSVDSSVIAWRPVRKPRADGKLRHIHRANRGSPKTDASTTRRGSGPASSRDSEREQERAERKVPETLANISREPGPPSRRRGHSEGAKADERRGYASGKHKASADRPDLESQRKATVDPNSPFAKLLELRPLLESKGKSRS